MSSPFASQGHAFLQNTIGAHPGATAIVIGSLVILIVVLSYYVAKYKKGAGKGGFRVGIAPYNNLNINGNNPMWYLGSMDAGNWGPIHRDATDYNVAAYEPRWRGNAYRGMGGRSPGGYREGLEGSAPAPASTPVVSPFPQVGPVQVCGRGWDPAASAEAQALATVGSLLHDSYGEGKLQGAIDGAFDANAGLNDVQLETLMHQGGTP